MWPRARNRPRDFTYEGTATRHRCSTSCLEPRFPPCSTPSGGSVKKLRCLADPVKWYAAVCARRVCTHGAAHALHADHATTVKPRICRFISAERQIVYSTLHTLYYIILYYIILLYCIIYCTVYRYIYIRVCSMIYHVWYTHSIWYMVYGIRYVV